MSNKEKLPPPGGGVVNQSSASKNAKRDRESPGNSPKAKKQTTILNYWLGNPQIQVKQSDNRFAILDTEETNDESSEIVQKIPKPPPIFIDGVHLIQPLYEMLDDVAPNE